MTQLYTGNHDDVKSTRKKVFLYHAQQQNVDGKYDSDIKDVLNNIDRGYFGFGVYDNFTEVVNDWFEDDEELKQKIVSDVDNKLHKYGLSANDVVYEVTWGTEPLYVLKLGDNKLVAVETSDGIDEIKVMPFGDVLSSEYGFGDKMSQISAQVDVTVALRLMGVFPKES